MKKVLSELPLLSVDQTSWTGQNRRPRQFMIMRSDIERSLSSTPAITKVNLLKKQFGAFYGKTIPTLSTSF